ncbi:MAG: aldo/keto reductase [Candidatus Methanomethylophilaceae archaeon]|nr:aldo/keto reductase [Candidatus Methanomethylophilaceae archaeon]
MYYNDYDGLKLSGIGFGAMRLPVINGNDADIDEAEAIRLVDKAYESGVNYFDTAWGYHGGNSEIVIGKALKKYPRDSFYLSTKFPGYDVSNFGKVEEIFEKQLEKCQVDYFDFYFMHNVTELNIEQYLDDDRYHTFSYLMEQRKKGRIKHLGFSCHGNLDTMKRFLDRYGKYMEFGMIQMNFLDYEFQDARVKADMLNERNIPIWVMEPLRGGMLTKLPEDGMKRLEELRPGVKPVEWAFRFEQSIPGVKMILSGMSQMDQMMENISIFDEKKPLDEKEIATLTDIAKGMVNGKIVPCTSCKYCVSHCPKGLDIPSFMWHYNETKFTGGGFISAMYIMSLPKDKVPSACIKCRKCEKVCPQTIKISEAIKELDSMTAGMVKAMSGQ